MIGRLRAIWRAALGQPIHAPQPAPDPPPPASPVPAPPPVGPTVEAMLDLVTAEGHPNINRLWAMAKDLEIARLNVKLLGYQLGLAHEYRLQAIQLETPGPFVADCKAVTQGDIETRWFRYWCEQLRERPRYHRKLWEFAYIMQAMHAADALRPGARVLLLGAAAQPTASYLAAKGAEVLVAQDQAEPAPGPGPDVLYYQGLVERAVFDKRVARRPVDLSSLPPDLDGFDACVSLGAANLRGSLAAGVDFMLGAIDRVKPNGVVVHIADFNYADDARTLDDWRPCLFQRRHFEQVIEGWRARGHQPAPADFSVGYQALDRFVDLPPFDVASTPLQAELWRDGWQAAHLKSTVDGFAVTSFALIARKGRD